MLPDHQDLDQQSDALAARVVLGERLGLDDAGDVRLGRLAEGPPHEVRDLVGGGRRDHELLDSLPPGDDGRVYIALVDRLLGGRPIGHRAGGELALPLRLELLCRGRRAHDGDGDFSGLRAVADAHERGREGSRGDDADHGHYPRVTPEPLCLTRGAHDLPPMPASIPP
jgi:hypothetical protein